MLGCFLLNAVHPSKSSVLVWAVLCKLSLKLFGLQSCPQSLEESFRQAVLGNSCRFPKDRVLADSFDMCRHIRRVGKPFGLIGAKSQRKAAHTVVPCGDTS